MRAVLGGIAALAVVVPAAVVHYAPVAPRPYAKVKRPQRVVAQDEIPQVEPIEFQDLAPEDARGYNATIPFVKGPNPAASPFRFAGDEAARARATDCLAAALWYEAGDDAVGQKAVAQVVLNRLRHPAFPKTVCGVVFQGEERSTGCQFTFTCDGALTRRPSDVAWERARRVAGDALSGAVYRPVGYATHYHTDWVVPYWSASLDKIAEVHTHLFFRWTGWWSTPAAFRRSVSADEPVVAKMASLSASHRLGGALDEAQMALAAAAPFLDGALPVDDSVTGPIATLAGGNAPRSLADDQNTFLVLLDPRAADTFPALARRACGDRGYCKVLGWADSRLVPAGGALSPQQLEAMGFSYLRERALGFDRTLWNCAQFRRADPAQCMKARVTATLAPAPAASPPGPAPVLRVAPPVLTGVRREPVGRIVPTPRPSAPAVER